MNYNIFDKTAPKMPKPTKGTGFCKLLLSKASKDMHEPLVPMALPALAAHLTGVEFMYSDNNYYELCGQMGHLIGPSGVGKAQLTNLIEAIMKPFRDHDAGEYDKLVDWTRQVKTKGANKEKPERPEVSFWFPPADLTNPAFIQNAIALENQGGRSQYLNLPEVEMADNICGGHKQVSHLLRNIYDRAQAGALRATADGVSGNPVLRVNMTLSSTPGPARKFYKNELFNGTFGRMVFSYKVRGKRSGKIPRVGQFDEEFCEKLDGYLERLDGNKGRFIIRPLNRLTDRLAEDMATLADLADDDVLFEVSHRALVSAWKAGCVMWIMNGQVWTKAMGELVEWLVYHDLWSKMQLFADMLNVGADSLTEAQRRGPKNMLDSLPGSFNEAQLEALRVQLGKSKEGANKQLNVWKNRGFIEYSAQTGLYSKTQEYLGTRVQDAALVQKGSNATLVQKGSNATLVQKG